MDDNVVIQDTQEPSKQAENGRSEGNTTLNLSQSLLLIALPDGQKDWQSTSSLFIKVHQNFPCDFLSP